MIFNRFVYHVYAIKAFTCLFLYALDGLANTSASTTHVTTKEHEEFSPSAGDFSIDEVVISNIKDMTVKQQVVVDKKYMKLPIQIYSYGYKKYQSYKFTAVRLASIAMLWTPTSDQFNGMVTIMVMDKRFNKDGVRRITKGSKDIEELEGKVLTIVTFDPNFQQLVVGALNFETAVADINKIEFIMVFQDFEMKDSVAGFLTTSWKTVGGSGGVYNSIQWDTFKFPRQNVQEVKYKYGPKLFNRLKLKMQDEYDKQLVAMQKIDMINFESEHNSDATLSRVNDTVTKYKAEMGKLLSNAGRHITMIEAVAVRDKLMKMMAELREAMRSRNIEKIAAERERIIQLCEKEGIDIPVEVDDINEPIETSKVIYGGSYDSMPIS